MSYQVGPAEVPGGDRTFKVKADTDIMLFAAVIQSTGEDAEVDNPAAAGAAAWGFAQEAVDYSEGQHYVVIRLVGVSHAIAFDGDIAAGDFLQVGDTDGRVDTAAAGDYVIARATQASAAKGDVITVQVLPGGYLIPAA